MEFYGKIFVLVDYEGDEFMNKLLGTFKNMFLDLFAMGKGFIYGFVMVGLLVLIGIALLYGFLFLKNIVF